MYRNLALGVGILLAVVIQGFRDHSPDPELPGNSKRQGADDSPGPQIGQLVAMVPYVLLRSGVAVDKSSIGLPRIGGLQTKSLAIEFPGFAKSQDAYNYWPRSVDFRDEEEMEFDSKAAVTPSDIIKSDADKIGNWSIYLDADQRWEGKWRYVRAPGAGPTDNLTRDEARYDALTTDP